MEFSRLFIKQVIIYTEELKITANSLVLLRRWCFLRTTMSESVLRLSSTEHKALFKRAMSVCDFLCCTVELLLTAFRVFGHLYALIVFAFVRTWKMTWAPLLS